MSSQNNQNKSLKLEILEKLSSLLTAGLGLVAALAWNEVIIEFFNTIFPKPNMLIGKLAYALFITVIVVLLTVKLGNIISKIKNKDNHE